MSLLTACQNVADEIGIVQPSSIIGNTDETAVKLYRAAVRTGSILRKKPWHLLIKTTTFTTSNGEPQYNLPSDYRSYIPETIWNQTRAQPVFPITSDKWSLEKNAIVSDFYDRVRLMGDDNDPSIGRRVTLHPTPTAVETFYYQYWSTNWLTDSGGTTERSAFVSDTDVVIFDEDLFEMGIIWRTLKSMGQPYFEEKVDFDQALEIELAQDGMQENLRADGNFPAFSNIPETGFGT
jgi:hypothetical protein